MYIYMYIYIYIYIYIYTHTHTYRPLPGAAPSAGPYERNEISKDNFKLILKKVSDKVIKSYQREGMPPPLHSDIAENQKRKIERLVDEYVKFTQKEGAG